MLGIIILAIIQGLTEFLPISSSAHLIILRTIFNIDYIDSNMALLFDVSLHLGTLLSILVYFYKDLFNLCKDTVKGKTRILWYIIVATIPAGLAGLILEDVIDGVIRNNLYIIASALIVMGIVIYIVDKNNKEEKDINDITLKDSLLIGCSEVFALIPGFSRSGVTMAMARKLKIKRDSSAQYSFYLSIPIILGAFLLNVFKDNALVLVSNNISIFVIGIGISFITGLLCIEFLLKYFKKHDYSVFMWYRLILGIGVLLILFIR